jgi:hypothetical protein
MLMRLRRALLVSAAGRNLAIDLIEEHGERALGVLDAMSACEPTDTIRRDILLKARREIDRFCER